MKDNRLNLQEVLNFTKEFGISDSEMGEGNSGEFIRLKQEEAIIYEIGVLSMLKRGVRFVKNPELPLDVCRNNEVIELNKFLSKFKKKKAFGNKAFDEIVKKYPLSKVDKISKSGILIRLGVPMKVTIGMVYGTSLGLVIAGGPNFFGRMASDKEEWRKPFIKSKLIALKDALELEVKSKKSKIVPSGEIIEVSVCNIKN